MSGLFAYFALDGSFQVLFEQGVGGVCTWSVAANINRPDQKT